jgi:hypothetical protein
VGNPKESNKMQCVKLVSWENEKVEIDIDSAKSIKFTGIVPNPGEEIPLMEMEIDHATLLLIRDFLNLKGQFPNIKPPLPASKTESIFPGDSAYKEFFDNIVDEQLLLLTLAAHKLQCEALEGLCAAVIASRFAEMDADEVVADLTEDELTTNEDDYYKWIGWEWPK